MNNPKTILVVTTSSLDGIKIKKYLKPISAHVVTGTNIFSDVFASFSDVFGGRSQSYQKQISSIYNEAVDKLKNAAFELGANCVVGLKVDMDEISGKGKSMFMLTAIGTAVIVDEVGQKDESIVPDKTDIIGLDKMQVLQKKKKILKEAEKDSLFLTNDDWDFIISNQVAEMFPLISKKYAMITSLGGTDNELAKEFQLQMINYLDAFPENEKSKLIYSELLKETNNKLAINLMTIVNKLQLLDLNLVSDLLYNADLTIQKRALYILTCDKQYYDKDDIKSMLTFKRYIEDNFPETGTRTTKKVMLSSKEKEIWICECGKENNGYGNDDEYCENCQKNIFGFKFQTASPKYVIANLEEKINLIEELLM